LNARIPPVVASLTGAHVQEAEVQTVDEFATGLDRMRSFLEPA